MSSLWLQVTGFGYEHDAAWAANLELFKHFTDVSQGVRRLGAAAVDISHVALGTPPKPFLLSLNPHNWRIYKCLRRVWEV